MPSKRSSLIETIKAACLSHLKKKNEKEKKRKTTKSLAILVFFFFIQKEVGFSLTFFWFLNYGFFLDMEPEFPSNKSSMKVSMSSGWNFMYFSVCLPGSK